MGTLTDSSFNTTSTLAAGMLLRALSLLSLLALALLLPIGCWA